MERVLRPFLAAALFFSTALAPRDSLVLEESTPSNEQFSSLVNTRRVEAGLPVLIASDLLEKASAKRVEQIIETGVFSHYGPSGELAFLEILDELNAPYAGYGEIIGWYVSKEDAVQKLFQLFIIEPEYLAALLRG